MRNNIGDVFAVQIEHAAAAANNNGVHRVPCPHQRIPPPPHPDGLQLWPHYDIVDNLLMQIVGTKRVILWPPSEEASLYTNGGSSSQVSNMDGPPDPQFPNFHTAHRVELLLEPGDVLFIPAMWYHCVQSRGFSVSVNMFWHNLDPQVYASKDLYGNRDLVASEAAGKAVHEALRALQTLPVEYQQFYGARLVGVMRTMLCLEECC